MLRTNPEPKLFVGPRLRRLRELQQISQAALARAIGISPSYMSQIECDQRPLPRPIMHRLAEQLDVPLSAFEDGDALRLVHDLREAASDPFFNNRSVSMADAHAAVQAAPLIAQHFLTLYRDFRARAEQVEPAMQNPSRPPVSGSAYEEVRDWVQRHHNYFDGLDQAAEVLAEREGLGGGGPPERLSQYLNKVHSLTVGEDASLLENGIVWKLNKAARHLALAAETAIESRLFWMCHIIGRLEQKNEIERVLRRAPLSSPVATALARVGLANYYAGALMMPYQRFLNDARSVRYDVARLQRRFSASFEQVCHRLSTMHVDLH